MNLLNSNQLFIVGSSIGEARRCARAPIIPSPAQPSWSPAPRQCASLFALPLPAAHRSLNSIFLFSQRSLDFFAASRFAARRSCFSALKHESNAAFSALHAPRNFMRGLFSGHTRSASITDWHDGCGLSNGGCIGARAAEAVLGR